ncbi:hypothetical protein B566_EDAN006214 [Ephemera danica]|nr:hypothetical protein B566_EDAN006214 [Ephemera danica]
MAILNKLFSTKKKNQRPHFVLFGKSDNASWKPFEFSPEQVRILLFRECDARRRKILFDSCSVKKIALEKNCSTNSKSHNKNENKNADQEFVEVTNGYGYKCTRPTEEVNLLTICDMIYGTVPLTFKGASMKVHSLKAPTRLMCTKLFPSPSAGHGNRVSLDDSMSSLGETAMCESLASSVWECGSGTLEKRASEEDSGFCGDASVRSISLGSCSNPWLASEHSASLDSRDSSCSSTGSWLPTHSSGSMSSLQRRWWRHLSTSMELCPLPCGVSPSSCGKRSKLEQTFFFDHISVVENIMNRLRAVVEKAYTRKETYWHLLKEGADELQQAIVDLFSAPRLAQPVWLGLVSSSCHSSQSVLGHTFLSDLCQLLASLDTKSTNFFISTLVTAVLTHHLGWVPTVLPGTSPPLSTRTDKTANQMLDSLAKSHPYNALWAQLGDLLGALGHPLRVSRTIVTGQQTGLLDKLVRVLSYFVRCGAVLQLHTERLASDVDDKRLLQPISSLEHSYSSPLIHPSISVSTITAKNQDSSSATLTSRTDVSSGKGGMQRTSSCLSQLVDQSEPFLASSNSSSLYPSLADVHSDLDLITEKVSKLCRVPTEAIMFHLQSIVPRERGKVNAEKQMAAAMPEAAQDVIFVLGEDEKLVNIKQKDRDNIQGSSLFLKSYHSVRFHSDACDEAEDCCVLLSGVQEDTSESKVYEAPFAMLNPEDEEEQPQLVELALPTSTMTQPACNCNMFAASLMGCTSEHYIADMVVQACTQDPSVWRHKLRRDLALAAHQPLFDKEVAEAVCVLANTTSWEVQVVSSHTYVVDKPGNLGVRQGMSQLVANMLESCLQHLESKLREICLHSHALAQLLLATDCCEMDQLTSSLNLEANDVPLLLAVASTHTPQVTQRYGLSFR